MLIHNSKNKVPLLSIITPVYNSEPFLDKCLNNVIDEGTDRVEHIIVDGGSSDNTLTIVKDYSDKYPHIRWISESDRGQSDAMNKGINLAKARVISFLNVDDFYSPGVFAKAIEIFQKLPEPSFVVGNCNILNEEGKLIRINRPKNMDFVRNIARIRCGFGAKFPVNPSAYFYHKSLHQLVGYYDVEDHYSMDLDFIMRVIRKINYHYVDEIWGNFRLISGTKTHQNFQDGAIIEINRKVAEKYYNTLTFLEWIKYFQQVIYLQPRRWFEKWEYFT